VKKKKIASPTCASWIQPVEKENKRGEKSNNINNLKLRTKTKQHQCKGYQHLREE
jgi:hypothetical protein